MFKSLVLGLVFFSFGLALALPGKYVVVPNRSDSSITLISTPKGEILKKITAQDTKFEFEPIYATSLPRFKMVAVSDRKNNQVIFFDINSFKYLGKVPASRGMFHMWAAPNQKDLYVVADIDRVVDVISVNRFGNKVVYKKRTFNPGMLFDTGKPHDVVVDNDSIFITMIGVQEDDIKVDYLLKYDRRSLQLLGQKRFSFDIHLGIPKDSRFLLVPEQTDGRLNFIDKKTFKVVTTVEDLPGVHGIYWNSDASKVYLANFASKGPMSLYEIRQRVGTEEYEAQVIRVHDLEDAKAHNVTVDFENGVMFVTHSGPNVDDKLNTNVSIFSVTGDSEFIKTVATGLNPLGILLVDQRP